MLLDMVGDGCPLKIWCRVKNITRPTPFQPDFNKMPRTSHGSALMLPRKESQLAPVVSATMV